MSKNGNATSNAKKSTSKKPAKKELQSLTELSDSMFASFQKSIAEANAEHDEMTKAANDLLAEFDNELEEFNKGSKSDS